MNVRPPGVFGTDRGPRRDAVNVRYAAATLDIMPERGAGPNRAGGRRLWSAALRTDEPGVQAGFGKTAPLLSAVTGVPA